MHQATAEELRGFLKHNVEDYLFGDIATMIAAAPLAGREFGALHYPLVASCFAGIELLGGLLTAEQFDRDLGRQYFAEFWGQQLYREQPDVGPALYRLVRHGLAHVYLTKGDFRISKGLQGMHLTRDASGAVWVDGAQLGRDLEHAYTRTIRAELGTGSTREASMRKRFAEMVGQYSKQATTLVNVTFPPSPPLGPVGVNGASGPMMTLDLNSQGPSTAAPVLLKHGF